MLAESQGAERQGAKAGEGGAGERERWDEKALKLSDLGVSLPRSETDKSNRHRQKTLS